MTEELVTPDIREGKGNDHPSQVQSDIREEGLEKGEHEKDCCIMVWGAYLVVV